MIDLTYHQEICSEYEKRIIMSIVVRLDKKTMIDILGSDKVFINGMYFKVPENQILNLLLNRQYGETKLELEQIT